MKHYDSIPKIADDGNLFGEDVWVFNKLDGQNFCVKYSPKQKDFVMFGSRTQLVDETSDQFGDTVRFFNGSPMREELLRIIKENSSKGGLFKGVEEITFFFEWYGDNSFAGRHVEGDTMHLALIDVFLKKKGYIEPKTFVELFGNNPLIELPEVIYRGKLTKDLVDDIWNNKVGEPDAKYPSVKEGVVCKRSTQLKGQRLPKVKFKTEWWINKLHSTYDEKQWASLE